MYHDNRASRRGLLGISRFALALAIVGLGLLTPIAARADAAPAPPTAAEAQKFVEAAEARLRTLAVDSQRASWVQETFITYDTEVLTAQANEKLIAAGVELAKEASRWNGVALPPEL